MVDNFSFQNAFATYSFQDGILYIEIKPEQIIDEDVVQAIVEDRITISNKAVVPVMISVKDDFLVLERKAVEILLTEKGLELAAAQALVVSSMLLRIRLRFFRLKQSKKVRARVFKRRSAARLWLMEYLNHAIE